MRARAKTRMKMNGNRNENGNANANVSHLIRGTHVQVIRYIQVCLALGTIQKISMAELLLAQHKSRSVLSLPHSGSKKS